MSWLFELNSTLLCTEVTYKNLTFVELLVDLTETQIVAAYSQQERNDMMTLHLY